MKYSFTCPAPCNYEIKVDAKDDGEAVDKIMRRVQRINESFSNYENIKKIIVLDRELTADSGLLTPSLKIRRRAVDEMFAARINKLYDGPVSGP